MIESVTLRNVEAHEKKTVEFGPGVTCVVGETDAGKSALIRSLLWVALNQPSGANMVHFKKPFAKATVRVDGREVVRKRGKTVNLYSLDGKKFKAFGSSVPGEISSLVNISEVNVQRQLDGPFWFSDSPGKISRELNRVVNLDEIDRVLAKSLKQTKLAASECELLEEMVKKAEEECEASAWVPRMVTRLESLRDLEAEIVNEREAIAELRIRVSDARKQKERVETLSKFANAGNSLVASGIAIVNDRSRIESLRALISDIRESVTATRRKVIDLSELEKLASEIRVESIKRTSLETQVLMVKAQEAKIWELERSNTPDRETLAREMAKGCPVCGATPSPRRSS